LWTTNHTTTLLWRLTAVIYSIRQHCYWLIDHIAGLKGAGDNSTEYYEKNYQMNLKDIVIGYNEPWKYDPGMAKTVIRVVKRLIEVD